MAKLAEEALVHSKTDNQLAVNSDIQFIHEKIANLDIIAPPPSPIMIQSDFDPQIEDSQPRQPHQSVVLQPSELYWMAIDPDYQTEEEDMDPLDISLLAQFHIADSSDEEACNNKLVNKALFPVFTRPFSYQPTHGKQKSKTGQTLKGYKQPRVQLDSKKLLPHIIPKETKRCYRINHKKALGKSNSMMKNWVSVQSASATAPPSSSEREICETSDDSDELDESNDEDNHSLLAALSTKETSSNAWIDECV